MSLTAAQILAAGFGAFSAAVLTSLYGTFIPQSALWGKNITHGDPSQPRIALTFDDGPAPEHTEAILRILADAKVPAAFFVIGRYARAYPELLRAIHSAGHVIGNHSFDHHHLGCFGSPSYWHRQLSETDDAIAAAIGQRPAFFRPPMGIKFYFTARASRRTGHTLITWNRRALDGSSRTSPEQILARLVPTVRAGDIVTLHDGVEPYSTRDPQVTIRTLPTLIEQLRARGFSFARLDELIGLNPYASASG